MHTLPGVFHYYFCDGHELRRPIHADWSPEITGLAATFRFIPVGVSDFRSESTRQSVSSHLVHNLCYYTLSPLNMQTL